MVKLTLPSNANIYAPEYKLYLPDKKLLQSKLKQWINEKLFKTKVSKRGISYGSF